MNENAAEFPDVRTLLPHEGPAVLLAQVLASAPHETTCSVGCEDLTPYARGGRVPTLLAVELFAQCAAVHRVLTQKARARGRGVLAAVRHLELNAPFLEADEVLRVTVSAASELGGFTTFDGHLAGASGRALAQGRIVVSCSEQSAGLPEETARPSDQGSRSGGSSSPAGGREDA